MKTETRQDENDTHVSEGRKLELAFAIRELESWLGLRAVRSEVDWRGDIGLLL